MVDANVALERDGKLRDRFYNRVMFPIRDVQGECIAFGGRIVGEGQPKYLNSQETPLFHKSQVLFGLDRAKAALASTGVAVVVEGYTDVIALSEAGVGNVVATLGTALTRQHIRLLSRHAQRRIVYLFDGDEAGQRAAVGSTLTCTGASQVGKAPAKCSVMTPMNRSMEPSTTRWIMMGRCFSLSAPTYSSSKRSGSWESSWMVPHCQVRPRESARWKSSLGP